MTDSDGRYQAPLLVPGTYTIRAELQGFKAIEQKGVAVRLGQTIEVPLAMQVGGLAETVEVTGSRPIVDTRSTTMGANIDSEQLSQHSRGPPRSATRCTSHRA